MNLNRQRQFLSHASIYSACLPNALPDRGLVLIFPDRFFEVASTG